MNIVNISFSNADQILIQHNGHFIAEVTCPGEYKFEMPTSPGMNNFCITNSKGQAYVDWITMFDLGKEKLVYFGNCQLGNQHFQSQEIPPTGQWVLNYEYPVFSWLHRVLDHGWLIK